MTKRIFVLVVGFVFLALAAVLDWVWGPIPGLLFDSLTATLVAAVLTAVVITIVIRALQLFTQIGGWGYTMRFFRAMRQRVLRPVWRAIARAASYSWRITSGVFRRIGNVVAGVVRRIPRGLRALASGLAGKTGGRLRDPLLWGLYASSILFVLGAAVALFHLSWGIIFMSLAVAYVSYVGQEIKEPQVGALFRTGKLVKPLRAGWHFPLIPIHNVQTETKARQQLNSDNPELEKADLYYVSRVGGEGDRNTRKIAVTVKMRVFFRLTKPVAAIKAYGGLNTEASRRDIYSTTFSALRSVVGKKDFTYLLSEKEELEEDIQRVANDELKKSAVTGDDSGYRVHVDIYDIDEEVQSVASARMESAEAEAFRAGKVATAIADPLKDNWPAAAAQSVTTIADAALDVADKFVRRGRQRDEEVKKGGDSIALKKSDIDSLLEKLRGGAA